ncbi:MAG: fatty acid desaturase [Oligoflexia bacterium]|nr:fatty acid desaturase [Oligoflexia bacterium]
MIRQFKRNYNYLGNFHLKSGLILLAINIGLYLTIKPDIKALLFYLPAIYLLSSTQITFVIASIFYAIGISFYLKIASLQSFAYIPIGILLAMPATALIHCASHMSIKPRFLNRIVGEFCGLFQLTGFPDWTIIHVIHHTYTDDPKLDPHPPMQLGYWQFTKTMREAILKSYINYYFKTFEQNDKTIAAIKKFGRTAKFDHVMKIFFWFFIFKPEIFSFLFITSIIFKMFYFSWLNYASHRPAKHGVEILNHTKGLYKIANFFSFGLFYHKNHHLKPSLFNPKYYKEETKVPSEIAA